MIRAIINNKSAQKGNSLIKSHDRFFNRELSWLSFNARVLAEAGNSAIPLLERLRFLSIAANNLDEFYMVRVAGLKAKIRAGITNPARDGLSPEQQLDAINEHAGEQINNQQRLWQELHTKMRKQGIAVINSDETTSSERKFLRTIFKRDILPILTPLAIDPAHPFPFIPNAGFALGLEMRRQKNDKRFQSLIPIPTCVDRFIRLPDSSKGRRFISLENVICMFIDILFAGCEILGRCAFRVLRDTDMAIEDESEDLVREFELLLRRRRRGRIVQVKLESESPLSLRRFLTRQLGARDGDVMTINGILGIQELSGLITAPKPEHVYSPFTPRFPERIREHNGDCFAAIKQKDIIVHHPYESFDVVVQFVRQAAADPDVVAIKQTLYRTSANSPIIAALVEAAEAGKNVTALIELKARFDEEANLRLARILERSGVQVVYGFIRYKIHAKVSMVVRREGNKLHTYTHFGTGNYHPLTAKVYTDLSLFTASTELGRDAMKLFNYVTGYSRPKKLSGISMSPLNLKKRLLKLIQKETAFAKKGQPATIWAKLNALVDPDIIDALYSAGRAGVQVQLVIRGICCLRPGIPGLSDNISVKSIIGRFLEHSRVVAFGNGHEMPSSKALLFISSADWMPRNLNSRVEAMTPVLNPTVHSQLLEQILVANLNDRANSWNLLADGSSVRVVKDMEKPGFSCHQYFMENPSLSGRGSALTLERPPTLRPNNGK